MISTQLRKLELFDQENKAMLSFTAVLSKQNMWTHAASVCCITKVTASIKKLLKEEQDLQATCLNGVFNSPFHFVSSLSCTRCRAGLHWSKHTPHHSTMSNYRPSIRFQDWLFISLSPWWWLETLWQEHATLKDWSFTQTVTVFFGV